MTIEQLFFELIQVSLCTRICLSRTPNETEWGELYNIAKKQSLIGVCFAGVQRLQQQLQDPPEMLYLTWMGMAAKIQQRNEAVNRQCAELDKRIKIKGCRYAILKGQGVASLYKVLGSQESQVSCDLSLLRQSGDIDVWVQNKSIPEFVEYVKGLGVGYKATAAHVECRLFPDTDVELHTEPAFFRSFRNDRKLKRWFQKNGSKEFQNVLGFNVPSCEFNLVYMMVHMYHHVLFEGLGLRQIMDYYFVLRAANKEVPEGGTKFQEVSKEVEYLGMKKFASGILWIIEYVFNGNSNQSPLTSILSVQPNEKYGRLILEDVMTGGNFGHHDEKYKGLHGGTAMGRSLNGLKRNLKFFALGPLEILSSPVWSTWHWWWRKRYGLL